MIIKSPRTATIMLLLVSLFWGIEYVLIDLAVARIPSHTFNAIRFALAALCLLPLLWFSQKTTKPLPYSSLIRAGMLLGLLLFIGFYTQTEALRFTSVSNAGFITGLSVPLVPLLGLLLFRNAVKKSVWLSVITATIGLYLLTIGEHLTFNKGDTLVLICAFAFAIHIILTGRMVDSLPVIPLSIVQLVAVSVYSTSAALLSPDPAFYFPEAEPISWHQQLLTPVIIVAVLVAGILGTGYAVWAQSASQKLLKPHKVALIFAAEPVFAHISAWLFLDETLGEKGMIGAGLIITGMLIAELSDRNHPPQMRPLDKTAAPE
ncbi:DMT family transporter [Neptunomonas antarctica]|uniref:Permease of the drug/metabolite transporter (DMT) superfamily n=1 Tax=Neptunomonas antarctica TaxID=619304 RepID=A0A1N7JAS2_9GAMM|nr:DMT family transporter [Neptunomonas antarctica]SIS46463.1 Permease of the drug/metabolite transporter (DMT) superfamily [Neptunomonas antarctica]